MKESEHRKAIEELWNEKLTIYKEQRDQEWEERRLAQIEEEAKR